jgi:hypothetical protein
MAKMELIITVLILMSGIVLLYFCNGVVNPSKFEVSFFHSRFGFFGFSG